MPKLVIVTKNSDLEIGKFYRGLEKGPWNEPEPEQGFKVIGRCTAEEWIDCCVAFGGPRDHYEMIVDMNGPWHYYEIQTD